MGGRAVEGTGLENRQACKRLVGSNPTPSANQILDRSALWARVALPADWRTQPRWVAAIILMMLRCSPAALSDLHYGINLQTPHTYLWPVPPRCMAGPSQSTSGRRDAVNSPARVFRPTPWAAEWTVKLHAVACVGVAVERPISEQPLDWDSTQNKADQLDGCDGLDLSKWDASLNSR